MAAVIATLNIAGWGIFVLTVLPHHFRYDKLGVGLGVAITAWTLGFRHAFDADHISAIDNVTRKLMAEGQRPLGTGFFSTPPPRSSCSPRPCTRPRPACRSSFDINKAGFTIAGLFVVIWAVALAVWRFGNIESRWDIPSSPDQG
jgi:high-affinity nickel permease